MTSQGRFGVKLGLQRIRAILDHLGHPERGLRGALVAGTNGKGSTCAFLASILGAAGLRVGLMPKPHLSSYRERVQLGSRPISEADFASALEALLPHLEAVAGDLGPPTEFEILTALALSYLAPRADRLVCEVGMGGRLDATNVLDLGVAVITNVSLDHVQHLGPTVAAIAAEKAAIIKPGNLAVTGCRGPELAVVEAAAAAAGASLWRLGRELQLEARWRGWEGSEIDLRGPGFEYRRLPVPLLGMHQAENAALAVAAARALGDVTRVTEVRRGLAGTRWPGRLEVVAERPRLLLDGGHNPDGLDRLLADLRRLIGAARLVVVFGSMADKDLPALLERLHAMEPAKVFFTAAASAGTRAADPALLASLYGAGGEPVTPSAAALANARRLAGDEGTVLVCGSLYLVGELRAWPAEPADPGSTAA
ncbi:MAG TPA: Mur ligase family protein [Candidatus Acidoferrales bacterium]|nr:Mur ligase family protein [Candidatus Acidoferrales bacterium]